MNDTPSRTDTTEKSLLDKHRGTPESSHRSQVGDSMGSERGQDITIYTMTRPGLLQSDRDDYTDYELHIAALASRVLDPTCKNSDLPMLSTSSNGTTAQKLHLGGHLAGIEGGLGRSRTGG